MLTALTVLTAFTVRAPSLLRRDMGDFWRANHRRGKDRAPSLPSLSQVKRGTDGAGAAAGAGLGARGAPAFTGTREHAPPRSGSRPPPSPTLPALPSQMAEQLMTLAYDNGINLFDTAEVYAAGK